MNDNYINESFKSLGTSLAVLLPFIQFGFVTLPESISGLYLNKESFFFTSLVTLLLSIFILYAYRSNPFFVFVPNKKKQKEWLDSFKSKSTDNLSQNNTQEENYVAKPFQINATFLALLSIFLFLVSSLSFIFLGLFYEEHDSNIWVFFLQSVSYILTFGFTVFVLVHFSYQEHQKKEWKANREERIQKAINLALEHRSFDIIPQINFVASFEQNLGLKSQLIVQVRINNQNFNIYTNLSADELIMVQPVVNQST